jgi:hypothetical protein
MGYAVHVQYVLTQLTAVWATGRGFTVSARCYLCCQDTLLLELLTATC